MATAQERAEKLQSDIRDEMQKLMDEAVTLVRGKADRVENDYLAPFFDAYLELAKKHPTLVVFITVFTVMSILPITTFITFALVIFSTFIFGAVTTAVVSAGALCAVGGSFLLLTLTFVLGFSVFLTCSYVALRLGYRLAFHVFTKEGLGLKAWIMEMLAFFGLGQRRIPAGEKGAYEEHRSEDDIRIEDKRTHKEVKAEEGWSPIIQNGSLHPLVPPEPHNTSA